MHYFFVVVGRCRHLLGMLIWYVVRKAPRNYLLPASHSLHPQSGQSLHSVHELPQCCSHPQSSQMNLIRLSIWCKPFKALVAITNVTVFTVLTLFVAVWIAVAPMAFLSGHYNSFNIFAMSVFGSLLCTMCFNFANVWDFVFEFNLGRLATALLTFL